MPLQQVIYVSSASNLFDRSELLDLLEQSRNNNQPRNITGVLLYKNGNFMQVLEGEKEELDGLLKVIAHDRRHKGLLKIRSREIAERQFPDWSMAFRDLDNLETQATPGYSDFLNTSLLDPIFQIDDRMISKLISNFAEINR